MLKAQKDVLIALNRQFTHRPCIRKLKEKRYKEKRKLRILSGLFKKKQRAVPLTEDEAVTIIARFVRLRQGKSISIDYKTTNTKTRIFDATHNIS